MDVAPPICSRGRTRCRASLLAVPAGGAQVVSFQTVMDGLLSLVIPVYNEADSLAPLLDEVEAALGGLGRPYEVVFVDDGSTDGSFAEMERLAAGRDEVRIAYVLNELGDQWAAIPLFQQSFRVHKRSTSPRPRRRRIRPEAPRETGRFVFW